MRSAYRHAAVTGTKEGLQPKQLLSLDRTFRDLRDKGFLWLHDGDCVGVDAQAAFVWRKYKGRLMLHPPTKDTYRANIDFADIVCEPRPYLVRDQHMADCSELLVACPSTYTEQRRSGTWTTVRYARKLRLTIILIFPDGSIVKEK